MSKFEVENKWVFIAGGSKGLGRALGKILASRGANVTLIARTEGPLANAVGDALRPGKRTRKGFLGHPSTSPFQTQSRNF
ncbi:hypothetical protein BDV59DRAFT_166569 [Aspergillus ambiguus]|uniref:uncharacterized protein n=1 Tax=Aspergillus ambiguus TaxID=176160 RepID=UPI003CCCDAA8